MVTVAEVLDRYMVEMEGKVARPRELGQRVRRMLEFFEDLTLDDLDSRVCREFAVEVDSDASARRMLGDLRAAIGLAVKDRILVGAVPILTLPAAPAAREDWLTYPEAVALARTMWHRQDEGGNYVSRHVLPYMVVSLASCSRASRVYRAGFLPEQGRPYLNLATGLYKRKHAKEKATKKRAPDLMLSGRPLEFLRRWAAPRTVDGVERPARRYVCEYEGRPVDPKKSFGGCVNQALRDYPHLFWRDDGERKNIVRHSLRHTGITWMALAGIDPYEIIKYAGITMKVFEEVYSHAFPGGMKAIQAFQAKARKAAGQE